MGIPTGNAGNYNLQSAVIRQPSTAICLLSIASLGNCLQPVDLSCYLGFDGTNPYQGYALRRLEFTIAYAQAIGFVRIHAENDTRNIPMLVLNEKLGYLRKPDLITLKKQLINK